MKPRRLRRRERKKMDQFLRDHAWNGYWYRPMKLCKIHYTEADILKLIAIRESATEAGRLRMVGRGLWQYAKAGELTPDQEAQWLAAGRQLYR